MTSLEVKGGKVWRKTQIWIPQAPLAWLGVSELEKRKPFRKYLITLWLNMMDEFTLSQSQKLAAFSLSPLNSLQLGFVSFSKPTQVCKRLAFIRFLSPLLKGLIKGAPHIIKQSAAHDCYNFVKLSASQFLFREIVCIKKVWFKWA